MRRRKSGSRSDWQAELVALGFDSYDLNQALELDVGNIDFLRTMESYYQFRKRLPSDPHMSPVVDQLIERIEGKTFTAVLADEENFQNYVARMDNIIAEDRTSKDEALGDADDLLHAQRDVRLEVEDLVRHKGEFSMRRVESRVEKNTKTSRLQQGVEKSLSERDTLAKTVGKVEQIMRSNR